MSEQVVECLGKKIALTMEFDGKKYRFDRAAVIDRDGGVELSQLRDDECIVAPGAVYRLVN
jgi:hypothetical protein